MTDSPDMRVVYAGQLRMHAHALIAMGYRQMDAQSFATAEETVITGELVRFMNAFLESDDAPNWAVYYHIGDDPPLNVNGKHGKSRPRVDIEFESTGSRGPRRRLLFEAKRLGKTSGHTVAAYLGVNGMGCFISGKYPLTHNEAGMLGYVQSGDEREWSDKINKTLANKCEEYHVASPVYKRQQICPLEHTYVSHHNGQLRRGVIIIHHVLLRFY